ncbi:PqqD family protein [Streptosporangium sp. NPDC001559]|uniref:PqqD family protein n=1 Tax=Streptosporangium sp. NPDC001559 TaxID=3366187 RepID=UPI0036E5F3E3
MEQLSPEAVPVPRLDVRVRNVGGTLTVAWGESVFELSETAGFLWKRVDGRRSLRELALLLAGEYAVDAETALLDTAETMTALADGGLVRLR